MITLMWHCSDAAAASIRAGLLTPCELLALRPCQEGPWHRVAESIRGPVSHFGEGHTKGVADALESARGVFLLWSMGM